MSDQMEETRADGPGDPREVEEVRAAWLGLIRLLASELARRLGRSDLPPGGMTPAETSAPDGPHLRPEDHPEFRSRDQGKG